MASVLEADPEVCRAIDQLAASPTRERRRAPREPFCCVQRIAQATGPNVPEPAAFFPVRCHDLSTCGFSFVVEQPPQFKSLVLALGAPADVIYLAADVRHCTEILVHPSGRLEIARDDQTDTDSFERSLAQPAFLVGCEFSRRLRPGNGPTSPPA